MTNKPIFTGLVFDEAGNPLETAEVGGEPFYVVNDAGFHIHIPADQVDHEIFTRLMQPVEGNEDIIAEQTAKMMGQDDIFSRAIIENQLKDLNKQFTALQQTGIPDEGRAYMGMMGFKVVINIHGEIVEFTQPASASPENGEE